MCEFAFHDLTSSSKREQAGPDLHEHAEAGFEQVCEASGHVLDVRAFGPVGVEHLLQNLTQEGPVGRLQKPTEHTHFYLTPHHSFYKSKYLL